MRLLLDTHVWVWACGDAKKIGKKATQSLTKAEERYVSPVSTMEIARLVADGRVTIQLPLKEWIARTCRDLDAMTIPINHEIALAAYELPEPFHRDPADRLLVAAARVLGLTLLTADERILGYPHVSSMNCRK